MAAPDVAGDVAKRASSTTRCALSRHLPHWVEQPVLRLTSSTDVAPAQTCSRMARSVTPLQIQMYIGITVMIMGMIANKIGEGSVEAAI